MEEKGVKLSISGFGLTEIPSRLFQMKSLTDVDLSDNRIESLNGVGSLANLKYLYLSNNRLETLPDEIYGLVKLEILDLSYNRIIHLSSLINQLVNLKDFNLEHNQLTTVPNEITQLPSLNALSLRNNPIRFVSDEGYPGFQTRLVFFRPVVFYF